MENLRTQPLDWSAASLPRAGEAESGDAYLVLEILGGVLVAVADGAGHGPAAAAAAAIALASVERHAGEPLPTLLHRCHESLRNFRGVALSICEFHPSEDLMSWAGVGNVAGVLHHASPARSPRRETLIPQHGLLGDKMPVASVGSVRVEGGDTLALATDGIRIEFSETLSSVEAPRKMADRILASFKTGSDDALVVVARYAEATR
jgi:phosphoserine phosphatase RsbX